jgi:AAHS family 4-hydroxybenzoate transporter-like MFS transporter
MIVKKVNVSDLIDTKIGPFQLVVFAICFSVSLLDGLDSQITSVTAVMMGRDFQVGPGGMGPLLSASQWGSLLGAVLFGLAGDRFGRRPVLICCSLLFGVATFLTAWANSFELLFGLRLLTGLGIGGAVPSFLALAAEYAPPRLRAGIVGLMFAAVPLGGVVAGLIGAALLDDFGWRPIYIVCGGASVVVCLWIWIQLPESLSFMIASGQRPDAIRRVVQRMAPATPLPADAVFVTGEVVVARASFRDLFAAVSPFKTMLLWIGFYLAYFVLVGTLVWTPGLMKQLGMSAREASLALAFSNIGGIAGIITAGRLIDLFRSGLIKLVCGFLLLGAIGTALLGYAAPGFGLVATVCAISGFFVAASLSSFYALAALSYPTAVRSTGIGWASACGRIGSSTGPILVGLVMASGLGASLSFAFLGAMALLNVIVIGTMGFTFARSALAAAPNASAS